MDFRFSRSLRIISVIVLAVFLWDFCLFESAFALTNSSKSQAASSKSTKQETETQKPEEKFQKALEGIETILSDTATDTDTKKSKLKAKKSEIEGYDTDIRKQFADTEKFLKEKGLPQEILDRHSKFTKSYDDNLKELKANLDNIDKAKDKAEVEARVKETKDFLEKRKPPTKHVPLDPNNLPHRNRKGKEVKLEEIRQDSHPSIVDSRQSKPILVAANGPLTGLLSQDSEFLNSPRPYAGEGWGEGVLLAQATTPPASAQPQPTAADLAENGIEIVFTPAIKAKAEELGKNPVKIYNWVRNNIEYVPTYGSIQGADMCLQTKQCNDMDTASLLISLLRYSGIYSHYASATIELPISKGVNWVGRFTDQKAALDFMASGGIPVSAGVSGGRITSARIQQHFWVEAWIDMIPSQGAVHKQGDTWVPLDASYKQYTYTQGIDIKSAVPFDAESFINQIRSTASIDTANNSVTNVNSLYVQQQMKDYQTRVQNYISQNNPNATVGDVLGKKEIVAQNIPVFMGTLPYKTLTAGTKYSSVPDNLRHKITFSVTKDSYDSEEGTPINITKNLPELAGKKITLSSSPATSADEAVINSFLPKPHADGTPIQPSELPTQLPAYLINVKPELRVDGVVLASGTPVGLGTAETFAMSFSAPNRDTDRVTRIIGAGEYTGIAIDPGRISSDQMTKLKTKLEATKAKLEAQDLTGITKDDILGDLLYITALSYYVEYDAMNYIQSNAMGVENMRLPSESTFSTTLAIVYFFGIPRWVKTGGLMMDVTQNVLVAVAADADRSKEIQFMLASGMNSSALEHSVPERFFSVPDAPVQGISAVKALKIANDQGIPVYTVKQSTIDNILPQLQLSAEVKADITNAVNAGKEVTVSERNITLDGWSGVGYIIVDPATGNGAYRISGGANGSVLSPGLLAAAALVLAVYAFIAMAVLATVGLPILALIAAVVTGLLVGFAASQLISRNFREFLSQTITDPEVIGAIIGLLFLIVAPFWLILVLAVILVLFAVLQVSYNYHEPPTYRGHRIYA